MRVGWVFSAIFDQYVVISRKRCILDTMGVSISIAKRSRSRNTLLVAAHLPRSHSLRCARAWSASVALSVGAKTVQFLKTSNAFEV